MKSATKKGTIGVPLKGYYKATIRVPFWGLRTQHLRKDAKGEKGAPGPGWLLSAEGLGFRV